MAQRYGTTIGDHQVALEFDKSLVVLNRARLLVDGEQVDSTRMVYGEDDLAATLDDGTEVRLRLHSGMVGELTRAQALQSDGTWVDLAEQS